MNRAVRLQVWTLSGVILANFLAQVIYYLHLYYTPQHPWPELRSSLAMGSVFALFLVGDALLIRGSKAGYRLMAIFLSLEFLFYLWNTVGAGLRGPGWFFHLSNPDPILWVVFAVGYLNLFASGYFLCLLVYKRRELVEAQA
jgi:hypothetical protein